MWIVQRWYVFKGDNLHGFGWSNDWVTQVDTQ